MQLLNEFSKEKDKKQAVPKLTQSDFELFTPDNVTVAAPVAKATPVTKATSVTMPTPVTKTTPVTRTTPVTKATPVLTTSKENVRPFKSERGKDGSSCSSKTSIKPMRGEIAKQRAKVRSY